MIFELLLIYIGVLKENSHIYQMGPEEIRTVVGNEFIRVFRFNKTWEYCGSYWPNESGGIYADNFSVQEKQ